MLTKNMTCGMVRFGQESRMSSHLRICPPLVAMLVSLVSACAAPSQRSAIQQADQPPLSRPTMSKQECDARHATELKAGVGSTLYVGCP